MAELTNDDLIALQKKLSNNNCKKKAEEEFINSITGTIKRVISSMGELHIDYTKTAQSITLRHFKNDWNPKATIFKTYFWLHIQNRIKDVIHENEKLIDLKNEIGVNTANTENASNEFLNIADGWIKKVVFDMDQDFRDCFSTAQEITLKSYVKSWDPNRALFTTYFWRFIKLKIREGMGKENKNNSEYIKLKSYQENKKKNQEDKEGHNKVGVISIDQFYGDNEDQRFDISNLQKQELGPEDSAEALELTELILNSFCRLDHRKQIIIISYHCRGMKVREIAKELGIDHSSVSRCNKATVKSLLKVITDYYKDELLNNINIAIQALGMFFRKISLQTGEMFLVDRRDKNEN